MAVFGGCGSLKSWSLYIAIIMAIIVIILIGMWIHCNKNQGMARIFGVDGIMAMVNRGGGSIQGPFGGLPMNGSPLSGSLLNNRPLGNGLIGGPLGDGSGPLGLHQATGGGLESSGLVNRPMDGFIGGPMDGLIDGPMGGFVVPPMDQSMNALLNGSLGGIDGLVGVAENNNQFNNPYGPL
jgi:hypothetical protein